ncbi:MAG: cation:proton antiporter [Vicinamibacterales bacterium]
MSFIGLVIVCVVAFLAPLVSHVIPRARVPAIVLEILAGIVIGPSVLNWVQMDEPIRVLSTLGLAFLLFLAGLELELRLLVGRRLELASMGFIASAVLAYAISLGLHALGLVESSLLVAICLSATALGIIAPILKDANESGSEFGQLVIAASSIADFATILALSLLFSRESGSVGVKLVLIGGFLMVSVVVVVAMVAAERWSALTTLLLRQQDSTAQIRIRGAFLLLVGFAAMAGGLGLEAILGAFIAGAMLSLLDHDYARTHPKFHDKLEAIGYGVFIPVFFVATGLRFDTGALFANAGTIVRVPIFLAALLIVRGAPALLYRPLVGSRRAFVAGLLQATSLPFIVATTTIGLELRELTDSNASALVAAGLLSVVVFPMTAVWLLRST